MADTIDGLTQDQISRMMMQEFLQRRRSGGIRVPNPRGLTPPGEEYVDMAYPGGEQSKLWSQPWGIMKPECVKPGYKYIWAKRRKIGTSTKVRTRMYRPVLWDEIDLDNPDAEVIGVQTDLGKVVCMDEFALFELKPEVAYKYYDGFEKWARRNLVQQKQGFTAKIPELTRGHMKGEFTETDKRPEPR